MRIQVDRSRFGTRRLVRRDGGEVRVAEFDDQGYAEVEDDFGRALIEEVDGIREASAVEVTDAAREMAREQGVDLTGVEGSGEDGRILKSDVEDATEEES